MDKIKEFAEFYLWLLERERNALVTHYRYNAFNTLRSDNLPEDTILSREQYQARLDEALQNHKINHERYMILGHQIAMMKYIIEQIESPTENHKNNPYYSLFEAERIDMDVPDVEYHNQEFTKESE